MDKIIDINIVDTDLHYKQDAYNELTKKDQKEAYLYGWKNDQITSQICLVSGIEELTNILYTIEDFKHDNKIDMIHSNHMTLDFIKSVKAYSKLPDPQNFENKVTEVPKGGRSASPDILYSNQCNQILPKTVQTAWLKFYIPADATPGIYTGKISLTADELDKAIQLSYTIEIFDASIVMPQDFTTIFDMELWQNPYAVAEYYEVEPFSKDHFELLIPHMELYKKMGGNAITATIVEEAWAGQTYSQNQLKFPSMVKWFKTKQGEYKFDYTDFDKWIDFCKLLNLGDKISCFSLAPGQIQFYIMMSKKRK